jgi:hypothetical protein
VALSGAGTAAEGDVSTTQARRYGHGAADTALATARAVLLLTGQNTSWKGLRAQTRSPGAIEYCDIATWPCSGAQSSQRPSAITFLLLLKRGRYQALRARFPFLLRVCPSCFFLLGRGHGDRKGFGRVAKRRASGDISLLPLYYLRSFLAGAGARGQRFAIVAGSLMRQRVIICDRRDKNQGMRP